MSPQLPPATARRSQSQGLPIGPTAPVPGLTIGQQTAPGGASSRSNVLLARGDQQGYVVPQALLPTQMATPAIARWLRGKGRGPCELQNIAAFAEARVPSHPCMSLAELVGGQSAPAFNRFNPGWNRSPHVNLAHERDSKRKQAACMLLKCVKFLESKGIVLGVRSYAPSDSELSLLLEPPRPGTAMRHARMFFRFQAFCEADPVLILAPLEINSLTISKWVRHLIENQVGRYTPFAALGCLQFMAYTLEFACCDTPPLVSRMAEKYRDDSAAEKNQAPPYSDKFVHFLEATVLGTWLKSPVDRLVAGRLRVAVNASTRMDDQRRTPVARAQWLLDSEGGQRAIITRASSTKTFPRHWSCSVLAADPEHDGWLQETFELLKACHGSRWELDDHFGRRCFSDRSGWDVGPPDPQADTCHIRRLMLEYNEHVRDEACRFSQDEILAVRAHGAKCTLIKAAQELGVSRRDLRQQGGWKGDKEDLMPDTYSRASQQRSLLLQEKVLNHLRSGGRLSNHVLLPVEGPAPSSPCPLAKEAEGREAPLFSEHDSDMEGNSHSDVSSSNSLPRSTGSRDSISVISDLESEGCWVDEFLINTQSGKYHKKSSSQLPAAVICEISLEEHSELHASKRIAELCTPQNMTHASFAESLYITDDLGPLEFFSGEVAWDHVAFPICVSLLPAKPLVPLCNRKCSSPATISAKDFGGKFLSHAYSACELCFPKEHKALHHACRHVCGHMQGGVVCTRRCNAAHEGTRTSHFCSEHGSPLKRNLDALEAAATDGSSPLAGAEELSNEQLDDWLDDSLGLDNQDSASADLVGDV